jgi:hypothetical protein
VGQRIEAVQEARRGHRQADARLLREEAGDRCGIAGVLLVAEREHAHALGLRAAGQVGDRDAGQAVDRVDAVQLERIDDQLEAVDRLLLGPDLGRGNRVFNVSHGVLLEQYVALE